MKDIDSLLKKIIPYPADYSHRDGFNNEIIIDNLESHEKESVEAALINLLDTHPVDTLIVETLACLKSVKSIPILYNLLNDCSKGVS
jgi:lipopolysaccharide biosynthesis glycosyltransferase